jgi:hypothetical protein
MLAYSHILSLGKADDNLGILSVSEQQDGHLPYFSDV